MENKNIYGRVDELLETTLSDLTVIDQLYEEEALEIISRWVAGDPVVDEFMIRAVLPQSQVLMQLVRKSGIKADWKHNTPTYDECRTFLVYFCFSKKKMVEIAVHITQTMTEEPSIPEN